MRTIAMALSEHSLSLDDTTLSGKCSTIRHLEVVEMAKTAANLLYGEDLEDCSER